MYNYIGLGLGAIGSLVPRFYLFLVLACYNELEAVNKDMMGRTLFLYSSNYYCRVDRV